MQEKSSIPDAWDDEWENSADKPVAPPDERPKEPVKVSKRERRAQHAEEQRRLWESAETPDDPIFLQAKDTAPLASDFKAPLKLLSRKPPVIKPGETSGAMGNLSIADDEDSEEEERRRAAASFAERQAKAQREREEKQRKYAEARERIMGSAATQDTQSRSSSKTGQHSRSRNSSRGKGRGKPEIESPPSGDQSPARKGTGRQQLFDPNYTSKPTSSFAQRATTSEPRADGGTASQHVRAPRGPDGSGRGGFGFSPRGDNSGFTT